MILVLIKYADAPSGVKVWYESASASIDYVYVRIRTDLPVPSWLNIAIGTKISSAGSTIV